MRGEIYGNFHIQAEATLNRDTGDWTPCVRVSSFVSGVRHEFVGSSGFKTREDAEACAVEMGRRWIAESGSLPPGRASPPGASEVSSKGRRAKGSKAGPGKSGEET